MIRPRMMLFGFAQFLATIGSVAIVVNAPLALAESPTTSYFDLKEADQAVILKKIDASGAPHASVQRILSFLQKTRGQEVLTETYTCPPANSPAKPPVVSKNPVTAAPVVPPAPAPVVPPKNDPVPPLNVTPCGDDERTASTRHLLINEPRTIATLDFSRPSTEPRLFVIDLQTGETQVYYATHGRGSGSGPWALRFSNHRDSLESSLGLYRIGEIYYGSHGATMRLYGLETSNDQAYRRDLVMHGAWYAKPSIIQEVDAKTKSSFGRLGLSWGCPAVDPSVQEKLLPLLHDGAILDLYQPDLMTAALSGQEVSVPSPAPVATAPIAPAVPVPSSAPLVPMPIPRPKF